MLPTATLVIACYLIVQLLKPALSIKVLPQDASWSNNALRALVFLIAYVLTVVNTITLHRLDWTGAWGLIPAAAAVAGVAIASYHILNDAVGPATPVTAPMPSKPTTATGILPPVEHQAAPPPVVTPAPTKRLPRTPAGQFTSTTTTTTTPSAPQTPPATPPQS